MRVLVTGASGLIGGRLISVLSHGGRLNLRAGSRIPRSWPAGIEGVVTDVSRPDLLIAACRGVDAVINLASMPEAESAADPDRALRDTAGGTRALVVAAVAAGVSRFVQLSTFKVYGNNPTGVITERSPTNPQSAYARSHLVAEEYAALHPSAVVLRLANGFGAPLRAATPCWGIIVNDFCRQAATTRRIVIRSDGLAWRNFVPLDDVVVALHAATESVPGNTYNLGSQHSMPMRVMADRVATVCEQTLGFRAEVSVGVSPSGADVHPLDYRTDRLRAAGVLLSTPVDEEIARTLRFARTAFSEDAYE